jgi:hypothetical protein
MHIMHIIVVVVCIRWWNESSSRNGLRQTALIPIWILFIPAAAAGRKKAAGPRERSRSWLDSKWYHFYSSSAWFLVSSLPGTLGDRPSSSSSPVTNRCVAVFEWIIQRQNTTVETELLYNNPLPVLLANRSVIRLFHHFWLHGNETTNSRRLCFHEIALCDVSLHHDSIRYI